MSGPYLRNRYSQRLQIQYAAWSCSLILHCCLPSNSLRYFIYFFFCHDFVRAISLEPLLAETPNWVCCLVLRSNFALLLTIQFASLFFFSRHDFVRAISLEPLLAETPNWVCCLVLQCNFALLLTIQFALFIFFFCHDFVRAISLEPILAETPNWVCCLGLRSNFALLLTIQFASLFFFSATILSGPYLRNRYSQRLQIKCAAWSCGLILHCCLPSNSLRYFFFPPRFCPGQITGTVTRKDSKLSLLLGPAV